VLRLLERVEVEVRKKVEGESKRKGGEDLV
jgi:hypothetical protein